MLSPQLSLFCARVALNLWVLNHAFITWNVMYTITSPTNHIRTLTKFPPLTPIHPPFTPPPPPHLLATTKRRALYSLISLAQSLCYTVVFVCIAAPIDLFQSIFSEAHFFRSPVTLRQTMVRLFSLPSVLPSFVAPLAAAVCLIRRHSGYVVVVFLRQFSKIISHAYTCDRNMYV